MLIRQPQSVEWFIVYNASVRCRCGKVMRAYVVVSVCFAEKGHECMGVIECVCMCVCVCGCCCCYFVCQLQNLWMCRCVYHICVHASAACEMMLVSLHVRVFTSMHCVSRTDVILALAV